MPLHDWSDDRGWDSVHPLWINSLLLWIQDRLPAGYRAYLGAIPGLVIAAEPEPPDLGVRAWQPSGAAPSAPGVEPLAEGPQPDFRAVAALHTEPASAVHVYRQGRLVASLELVSPRNKDRPASREFYRNRCLGYLWSGVHLMLADVHRRPSGFSFVEAMAAEMECQFPVGLPPHAVSWNVGGPTPEGGRFLDSWYRPLVVGTPLPSLPLVLAAGVFLVVDLEHTYAEAAHRAYLD
jgi:hypothetical protein